MSAPATPPWDRGIAERTAKTMFGNSALHRAAAALAGAHPRALGYITQAPVLVLSATASIHGSRTGRQIQAYAGPPMRLMCERGDRLRDVMAHYGCGFQLRRLVPSVLHPVRWPVIHQLGKMPPQTLAPIIPVERGRQDVWLRALAEWSEHCRHRIENPWFLFDWAAGAVGALARGDERQTRDVADLAIQASRDDLRADAVFDRRWTFAQALAATERWHRAIARRRNEVDVSAQLGVGFADPVDYAPFPSEPVAIGGYTFVPLRSCEDLWVEGHAMRHCVATYSPDVVHGMSRIFSIRKDGRRVATAEWTLRDGGVYPVGGFGLRQLRGPCNGRVARAVIDAARAFSRNVGECPRDTSLRALFPDAGGVFSNETAA